MKTSDLDNAIRLAIEAHAGQTDKAGAPYILHPLRVMLSMNSDQERIAAVLHDVVEDSDTVGHGDILALYGKDIHEAVYALTRQDGEDYADFILRCRMNDLARTVKVADILDNLSPSRNASLKPHHKSRYESALKLLSATRQAGKDE